MDVDEFDSAKILEKWARKCEALESENASLREQLKAGPKWRYPTWDDWFYAKIPGRTIMEPDQAFNAARELKEGEV